MSTTTASSMLRNPWIVAMGVSIATFMEVLDTSIANVALRYIAGGLSAAENDSEWVITSYLAANAAVLLLSGWLSSYFGRRNYYLASVALFTISSAACGFATSIEQLVFFRILQGIGGGGLQPVTQAVLVDTFPPEKQGSAQTLFGISALIAPILGPTLGGYISDNYSWRWIFLINIPAGVLAFTLNYFWLEDPPYLKAERASLRSKPLRFDYVGLGLIILAMAAMEVLLSKGQEWDWYNDPFWRVQTLFILFVGGLVATVIWESWHPAPILNLAPFRDRNFVASGITSYVTFAVVYTSMTLLPGMLQSLFGYNAVWSGLVMSPAGLFTIPMMLVVSILLGMKLDARVLVILGAIMMAVGSFWFSRLNLDVSPSHVIWPRVVQQIGTAFIFAPLSVAAFMYLPKEHRGAAAGLFAVLRNEGGSAGTSLGKSIVERRESFHDDRLVETLQPLYTPFQEAIQIGQTFFEQVVGDPATSATMALQAVDNFRQQQALAMAYLDAFWICGVIAVGIIPLALLMRRSVAEEGSHVGAE
ncbi:DHA2 family efflux MFS transporter permease subunit [Singulisphaera sp. PoT]|uniref:DHA2 family efflux MFS transporter permease subunit n=1 Tax=Singulisphaera sp. PoT TaxID=3411797 RepID=UPI003BF619F9